MIFNGNLDPCSNVSGQVMLATNSSGYAYNFPPMDYAVHHLSYLYGCSTTDMSQAPVIFHNGTKGNSTTCRSWPGCQQNLTYCLSEAGHRWYGFEGYYHP